MIIYLHGFSSSAQSHKACWLQANIEQPQLLIPEFPSHQPVNAINYLTSYIQQQRRRDTSVLMLIGSSLGGYYAQYLGANLGMVDKIVMINPALQPHLTLAAVVGRQTNMVTGETFEVTAENLQQLALYDVPAEKVRLPTLVLLDEKDEIIDVRVAQQRYGAMENAKVITYPGGNHWFAHLAESLPEILAFYNAS